MAPVPPCSRLLCQQYTSAKAYKKTSDSGGREKEGIKGKIEQQTKLIRLHYESSQENKKAPKRWLLPLECTIEFFINFLVSLLCFFFFPISPPHDITD